MAKNGSDLMRYKMSANVLKALAHPVRLQLVDALRERERCVCELVEIVGSERTGISKHLGLLRQVGIVTDRKDGLKVFYSLAYPCVVQFFSCVNSVMKTRLAAEQAALQ